MQMLTPPLRISDGHLARTNFSTSSGFTRKAGMYGMCSVRTYLSPSITSICRNLRAMVINTCSRASATSCGLSAARSLRRAARVLLPGAVSLAGGFGSVRPVYLLNYDYSCWYSSAPSVSSPAGASQGAGSCNSPSIRLPPGSGRAALRSAPLTSVQVLSPV